MIFEQYDKLLKNYMSKHTNKNQNLLRYSVITSKRDWTQIQLKSTVIQHTQSGHNNLLIPSKIILKIHTPFSFDDFPHLTNSEIR